MLLLFLLLESLVLHLGLGWKIEFSHRSLAVLLSLSIDGILPVSTEEDMVSLLQLLLALQRLVAHGSTRLVRELIGTVLSRAGSSDLDTISDGNWLIEVGLVELFRGLDGLVRLTIE